EEIAQEEGQANRPFDQGLRHLRVLAELTPRLALLERAAAEAAPLRNLRRDLHRVPVRVLLEPEDLLGDLDLRDVVLWRPAADVEHARPWGLHLDLCNLVVVLDRVDVDHRLPRLPAVPVVLRNRDPDRGVVQGGGERRKAPKVAGADEGGRG